MQKIAIRAARRQGMNIRDYTAGRHLRQNRATPSPYLSDFFEKNRASYYDGLSRVRESNDIPHWMRFFLSGVVETAEKGVETF